MKQAVIIYIGNNLRITILFTSGISSSRTCDSLWHNQKLSGSLIPSIFLKLKKRKKEYKRRVCVSGKMSVFQLQAEHTAQQLLKWEASSELTSLTCYRAALETFCLKKGGKSLQRAETVARNIGDTRESWMC